MDDYPEMETTITNLKKEQISDQVITKVSKFFNSATFIDNTSYHPSIGCAPTVIFHGRDPVKPMDNRFCSNCIQKSAFNYDFVESLCDEMLKKFQSTKESLAKSFNRYRRYYDQKARAIPLTANTYCPDLLKILKICNLPLWYTISNILTLRNLHKQQKRRMISLPMIFLDNDLHHRVFLN